MPFDLRRAEPTRPSLFTQAIAVPVVLWVVLAVLVAVGATQGVDDDVADWGYDIGSSSDRMLSFLDGVAIAFSNLPVIGVLLLVAAYTAWRGERRLAGWVVVSGTLALGGNALLKLIFRRDRPSFDEPLRELVSYSFPSGHSAAAGLLVTVATLLTIVLTGRGWRRRILIALWVLIGLGVGLSRILLGVHYLSDVIAGFCVGVAVTLAAWHVLVPAAARLPHELAVLTGTGRKRFAVVVNPSKVGDLNEFKARVLAVSRPAGWREPLWFETTIEDTGRGQTQAALEADVDLIVAAGGDGTVRAVCEEAARTGIAVGIIPHGTGNLLARNIGIPLNMRDALEVAFGGQDKAVDLATFRTDAVLQDPAAETDDDREDADENETPTGTETCFLVMAGLGMDAAIMTGVDDNLKQKVGWFAYFVSGVKALRFPAMRVEISVDDGEFKKFRARTVVIGNVGFLQAGIPLLPDAQIDDGQLDVVVLAPKRFIGWLAIVVRVMGRQRRTNERLDRLAGKKVVIRAEKPMPMQLDGDPVGDGTEITAEVQHGVLLVRVPIAPAPAPA
ncbi:phosphatase PAP2 family protein [Aeromicrobium terrae]|uniref:Phosphatase PAP2 family protein n=1 Tax=Aeromicrobium terrae TaxID=2498846 RepID=A0A5C8NCY7_9ACTN|nr:phosphatase PAP2 family protein [Aeromicrobium terrae]TXL57477.1 phosphatase PAP2 family protein [Aeromicrobium terrae]